MKMGDSRNGFVMLEVMAVIAILMAAAASMLVSASAMNRRAVRKIEKSEAYDAAVTAVQLMADAVMNGGEDGQFSSEAPALENGLEKRETRLVAEPKDGSEAVAVPVVIWTERNGNMLILYAESAVGGQKEAVSLTLEAREEEPIAATPSSASYGTWMPVRYDRVKKTKEKE